MSATLLGTSPVAGESLNGLADSLYEVIDGRYVEKPPMSAPETSVASELTIALGSFVRQGQMGRVRGEMLFRLAPDARRSWRPDVAFVSYERWARDRAMPEDDPWEVVPDLAVEVISPTNTANATMDRLEAYFAAGGRSVWIVYPRHGRVYVYDSPTAVRILRSTDEIDGGPVLPGLKLAIASLFEDVPPPAGPAAASARQCHD